MKAVILFIMSCYLFSSALAAELTVEQETFQQQAKLAIKDFATQLKTTLMSEMQQGGPVSAIKVCKEVAPKLADELSDKYQLKIGRTSLKIRNPNNLPDQWEKTVLADFEQRSMNGENIKKISFSEQVNGQMRFMKAIPTGEVCLNCHGINVSTPVKEQLNKLYPDDKATGFKLGDIRGAFTVSEIAP